jgi:hypothetical protein
MRQLATYLLPYSVLSTCRLFVGGLMIRNFPSAKHLMLDICAGYSNALSNLRIIAQSFLPSRLRFFFSSANPRIL